MKQDRFPPAECLPLYGAGADGFFRQAEKPGNAGPHALGDLLFAGQIGTRRGKREEISALRHIRLTGIAKGRHGSEPGVRNA